MKGRIAIEPALSNVKNYLTEKGYTVESMTEGEKQNLQQYDAIVVTGLSKNLLGIEDTDTRAVVINADGLTPQEVAGRISDIE